jgi:hypothetical protein
MAGSSMPHDVDGRDFAHGCPVQVSKPRSLNRHARACREHPHLRAAPVGEWWENEPRRGRFGPFYRSSHEVSGRKGVDARDKPEHDGNGSSRWHFLSRRPACHQETHSRRRYPRPSRNSTGQPWDFARPRWLRERGSRVTDRHVPASGRPCQSGRALPAFLRPSPPPQTPVRRPAASAREGGRPPWSDAGGSGCRSGTP